MRAVTPEVLAPLIEIAKDQPQYRTVTAALVNNYQYGKLDGAYANTVLLAYRPDEEERARLAVGEDLYVALLTFGGAMQPILVLTGKHEAAETFGVRALTAPAAEGGQPVGATGDHPDGQLAPDDEGGIELGIADVEGKVVIDFGKQVAWLRMTPAQAEALAQLLLQRAAKARGAHKSVLSAPAGREEGR